MTKTGLWQKLCVLFGFFCYHHRLLFKGCDANRAFRGFDFSDGIRISIVDRVSAH